MNATITIDSDPTGETRIVGMEFDDLDREDVRNKLTDFWRGFTSCNCHVKFADECRTCGQRDSHRDGCPNAKQWFYDTGGELLCSEHVEVDGKILTKAVDHTSSYFFAESMSYATAEWIVAQFGGTLHRVVQYAGSGHMFAAYQNLKKEKTTDGS